MLVNTVFVLKPIEAFLPGEIDGTTDTQHTTDVTIYRQNQARGQFSKNKVKEVFMFLQHLSNIVVEIIKNHKS